MKTWRWTWRSGWGGATDNDNSSVDGHNSEDDQVDLALLGVEESQAIVLEAALNDIQHSRIPTDLGPLTTADKALNVWNDPEKLHTASVALLAMSKNNNFDIILCACLTGLVGVLNIHLDPSLQNTLREASVMVSKVEAKGVNHVHMLRRWILKFIQSEELPQPNYSHSHWTVLDDEDISQLLQLQILAHTKQLLILLKLLPVRQSRTSSHSLALSSQQPQSAQQGDGYTRWTGTMAPHNMACIWMAMSTQMLLHTESPLLQDGGHMRSLSTPRTIMAKSSHHQGGFLCLVSSFTWSWTPMMNQPLSRMILERLTGPMQAPRPPHIKKRMANQLWCLTF